jgi:hypothetical protein
MLEPNIVAARLNGWKWGRAWVLAAALVVVGCALSPAAQGSVGAGTPFREVAHLESGRLLVWSDGVRFAWIGTDDLTRGVGPLRVFDTLRGRSFRLTAPRRGCQFNAIGGGFVLWGDCPPPRPTLITDLATRRTREPAGIERMEAMSQTQGVCRPGGEIGRYWFTFFCGSGEGGGSDPFFLNHRTGALRSLSGRAGDPDPLGTTGLLDLDYAPLYRSRRCAPLERAELDAYAPPFALQTPRETGIRYPGRVIGVLSISLRRCGSKRAEILSRCRITLCRTPQLGSRYVTWGEHKRVYAYLPRIRRRVLVGRAPTAYVRPRKLRVAHTCNRVFLRWGYSVYVARFEPTRGAPPCQAGN